KLEWIDLEGCVRLDSVEPLAALPNLTHVDFQKNRELPPLDSLKDSISITSANTDLCTKSVTDLEWVPASLQSLSAVFCQIESIDPLSACANLRSLDLTGNERITDISALAELPKLENLNLNLTSVTDLSPLVHLEGARIGLPPRIRISDLP